MRRPSKLERVHVGFDNHPWVEQQRARLRDKWDLLCPVLGDVGKGKSTAAIQLATAMDPSFVEIRDGEIRFPRLVYSTADARDVAMTAKPYSAIVLDEATEGALAMEWQKGENKEFAKFAIRCRKLHLAVFICVPDMGLLLKFLRTQRCNWLWWMEKRGLAFSYYGEKGIWQREMFRHYVHQTRVPPLPPRIEQAYLEHAARAEKRIHGADEDEAGAALSVGLTRDEIEASKRAVLSVLEQYPNKPSGQSLG